MLLNEGGVLHPILMSTNLVGTVAVPMSSIIVGAELYEAMNEVSGPCEVSPSTPNKSHFRILTTRSVFTGRNDRNLFQKVWKLGYHYDQRGSVYRLPIRRKASPSIVGS